MRQRQHVAERLRPLGHATERNMKPDSSIRRRKKKKVLHRLQLVPGNRG